MAFENVENIIDADNARDVLRYAFMYNADMVEYAERILRDSEPNDPLLGQVVYDELGSMDIEATKYKSAVNYKNRAAATNSVEESVDTAASDFMAAYENQKLGAAEFEEENEPTLSDSQAAERNFDMLLSSLDEFEENEAWKSHVQDLLNTVDFVDKDGKSDETVQNLSAEAIWDAVKTDILVRHTLDFDWMRELLGRDEQAKEEMLVEEIKNLYAEKVASMVAAERAREVIDKQGDVDEKDQNFNDRLLDVLSNASYWSLTNLLQEKPEKTKISVDTVLASVSDSWRKLGNFISHLKEKGFNSKFVKKVENYKSSFNEKMKKGFGKAWQYAKEAANSFVNTKHQFAWNLAATAAVTAVSVACPTAAIPALKAYAMYTGASGLIFPFVNKKTARMREANKKLKALQAQDNVDQETFEATQKEADSWKGRRGLKRAISEVFTSDRERKTYYIKAATSLVVGGLTYGIAGSAAGTVANAATVAATRVKQSLTRAAGSVGAQFATLVSAYVQKIRHPSEEAQKFVRQSWIGLGLGTVIAGAAAWWQMERLDNLSGNNADALAGQEGAARGGANLNNEQTADSVAAQQNGGQAGDVAQDAPQLTETEQFYNDYEAPMEWSEDMGISEREYNWLRKTLGGVYATAEGAEHFNTPQVDSDLIYQDYMRNLATYMHEHPEQFEGQQPIKVLHDIMQRHALSVAVHSDGDKHLVATLTANGEFTYGNPSFNEPMNAWWKILCNSYKNEPAEGVDLKAPLANLQSDLDYAAKHGNGNYIIGHDCEQTAYARGFIRRPRPRIVVTPKPRPEPVPVVEKPKPQVEVKQPEKVVEDVPQLSKKEVVSREIGDAQGPQAKVTIKEGVTNDGQGLRVDPNPNNPNGKLKDLGTYGLKRDGGR